MSFLLLRFGVFADLLSLPLEEDEEITEWIKTESL